MTLSTLRRFLLLIVAICIGCNAASLATAQPFPINWVGADGANYDVSTNWDFEGFAGVPDVGLGDVAVIGNVALSSGQALINSTVQSPGGIVLGDTASNVGTLNIVAGSITAQENGAQNNNGGIVVGNGGQGFLNISGGALGGVLLSSNTTSQLSLSGTGALSITDAVTLSGVTQVSGGLATFDAGTLGLLASSSYAPEITATGLATANVTGAATLAGSLDVTFNGAPAPTPGDSWNLIEAGSFAGGSLFSGVNVSGLGALPQGQQFRVLEVDAGGGRVAAQLRLIEVLTLEVDRFTGAMSIAGGSASGVAIDGYQVRSQQGFLETGASWDRIAPSDGWEAANPSANQLSELQPSGAATVVSQGSPISLGTPYTPDLPSLPFGTAPSNDLSFSYSTPDGDTFEGVVEFLGDEYFNNFVLTIDPDTGLAELKNDSTTTVTFDGYQLTSESGSLSTGDWEPLSGDWQSANPSASQLAELNPSSSLTLTPGQRVLLGELFPDVGSVDPATDLVFQASNSDAGAAIRLVDAVIRVADISDSLQGDFNGDGQVDSIDYAVWRENLGAPDDSVIGNAGDGVDGVTQDDFNVWLANFGASSGGAATSHSLATAPEPSCFCLAIAGLLAGLSRSRNRASQTAAVRCHS